MTYKYWLVACVAFVILEILPPPTHFFFVCMAFGALGASIAALFSTPYLASLGRFCRGVCGAHSAYDSARRSFSLRPSRTRPMWMR